MKVLPDRKVYLDLLVSKVCLEILALQARKVMLGLLGHKVVLDLPELLGLQVPKVYKVLWVLRDRKAL
jgi:hypothetical protein